MQSIRYAAISLACALVSTASLAQGLIGATVTTAVYCCGSATEPFRISNFVTSVVGPNIEVPGGALVPIGGFGVIPVTMDIDSSTIRITYTESALAAGGSFNGYVFQFTGAPAITEVSLDYSGSTLIPDSWGFTTDNRIFFNVAGLSIPSGATSILNVSTVPEASSVALMLAGLATTMAVARRRRVA